MRNHIDTADLLAFTADIINNLIFAVQLFFQFADCIQHISMESLLLVVALKSDV